MIEVEIKSVLDDDLNREKILKLRPENVDVGAIEVFQRIFVEVLNFDIVRGTFEGVAESVSTRDWNKQAEAVEACIIAERDDFRVLYVRLRKLTRTAQRYAVSSIIRERWASKGEFIVVFYAQDSDVWHIVCPYVTEGRTILRRYVVGIGEKHRTVSENLANMDVTIEAPLFERVQDAFRLKPVTEQFYGDYKNYFSKIKECIRSLGIVIRNSKRYSHLFLNRLMFVYFIQKKGWIGDNKEFVKWFLEAYREFGEKDRFHEKWLNNLFFKAMNKPPREKKFNAGFPREVCEVLNGIPYLNGGLFEKDDVDELGIELPDSLVMEVIEGFLENYNFTITEESPFDLDIAVDPAMLGKIYESLIAEEERGKAGIFYTPRIEVDLMCRLALYEYFQQQRTDKSGTLEEALVNQLLEKVIDFLFTPLEEWNTKDESEFRVLKKLLDSVKVIDPACGSGAFLVGMLSVLQESYAKMGIEVDYDLKESIINNNLYGVDIKDWAVRMAEFRLWLALVESEDKVPDVEPVLPNFSFKLQVGDSIVQKVGDDIIKLEKIKGELEKEIGEDLDKLESLKERYFKGEKQLLKEVERAQRSILEKYIDKKIASLQKKKSKQTTLEGGITAQTQSEIRDIEDKITLLKKSKNNIRKAGSEKLFVWDLDFPEVMLQGGFDVVIANPPYVRQEKIIKQDIDPEELESHSSEQIKELKDQYKEDLIGYILETYDMNVGRRCDLYVYFFFKGFELLNPKGSMVFISSNSWLDVDYGKHLQEGLLRKTELQYVIDNSAKRSFEESEINTVISVIRKKADPDIFCGEASFIVFKKAFENIVDPSNMKKALLRSNLIFRTIPIDSEVLGISAEENLRVLTLSRESLWKLGNGKIEVRTVLNPTEKEGKVILPGSYSGSKWGRYLRAPDVYFKILEKVGDKLAPLERCTTGIRITRGITTGANDFFFVRKIPKKITRRLLDRILNLGEIRSRKEIKSRKLTVITPTKYKSDDDGPLFLVEENCLMGAVQNTDEHDNLYIKTPKVFLFAPRKKKVGEFARDYIKWGKKEGYHKRLTCRSRKPWWQVISRYGKKPTSIGFNYNIHDTGHFYYSKTPLFFSDNFHTIYSDDSIIVAIGESTLTALFINVVCRVPFGGGKAKLQTYELSELPSIKIDNIPAKVRKNLRSIIVKRGRKSIKSLFEELGASKPDDFSIDKIDRERLILDKLIMEDILGLSKRDQLQVYRGVVELIGNRFEKARSV